MYAAENDGGQATFGISQVTQMVVLRQSDLFCTGPMTLAMVGY